MSSDEPVLQGEEAATAARDTPESREALELLAIVDRLESLLERSDLSELEVEAGGTAFVLRRHVAAPPLMAQDVAATPVPGSDSSSAAARDDGDDEPPSGRHAVLAPLTGLFYTSPSPGADPYVRVGGPVNVGQVIGLIEAMKLFNEIKSDISGTVTRIAVETGTLVKQKQSLIEVQPS